MVIIILIANGCGRFAKMIGTTDNQYSSISCRFGVVSVRWSLKIEQGAKVYSTWYHLPCPVFPLYL